MKVNINILKEYVKSEGLKLIKESSYKIPTNERRNEKNQGNYDILVDSYWYSQDTVQD